MTLQEAINNELFESGSCLTENERYHGQLAYWLQNYKDMLADSGENIKKMTLYDMNRMIYSQLPQLTIDTNEKEILCKFFADQDNKYYMLMCKELSYYTCLRMTNVVTIKDKLVDIITSHIEGYVVDIEQRNDGNIEIWIHMEADDEAHMFMLFPYDWGVIEC